jgi:XTP/dITP diphosphohydrolase
MLRELEGKARTCRFRTVALLRFPDGREVIAEGVCEGSIAESEIGERGFGYDPLFIARDGGGQTFAQMSASEKHGLSHRGKAFRALSEILKRELPTA